MPVYEFECLDCGHRFELVLSFAELERKERQGFTCPKCRHKHIEQLVAGVTVQTPKKS